MLAVHPHIRVWLIATVAGWAGGVFAYPHILPATDARRAVVAAFAGRMGGIVRRRRLDTEDEP